MSNPRTLHQIEFLTDGNAVLRFTDGHETLVPSGEVSEELCQIQGMEWGAVDLRARITHLQTAIATHHATKHGSEPATARSVRSLVDRTLYEAAGTPHAVLAWDAGRDEGGATKGGCA